MISQFPEHEWLTRSQSWRVRVLSAVAKAVGVLIHIDGLPYGSKRRLPPQDATQVRAFGQASP